MKGQRSPLASWRAEEDANALVLEMRTYGTVGTAAWWLELELEPGDSKQILHKNVLDPSINQFIHPLSILRHHLGRSALNQRILMTLFVPKKGRKRVCPVEWFWFFCLVLITFRHSNKTVDLETSERQGDVMCPDMVQSSCSFSKSDYFPLYYA